VPVSRAIDVFAIAMLDALPVRGAHTASVDGATMTLFETWPIRPAFAVGARFGDAGR
jgi:hypothetical protein